MNLDAILAFVGALLTSAATLLFPGNAAVVAILHEVVILLGLLGTAFHLDGVSLIGSTNTPVAGTATATATVVSK